MLRIILSFKYKSGRVDYELGPSVRLATTSWIYAGSMPGLGKECQLACYVK